MEGRASEEYRRISATDSAGESRTKPGFCVTSNINEGTRERAEEKGDERGRGQESAPFYDVGVRSTERDYSVSSSGGEVAVAD